VLDAVEDVAPVAHAVGPWREHRAAEAVRALARAEAVEPLLAVDGAFIESWRSAVPPPVEVLVVEVVVVVVEVLVEVVVVVVLYSYP
jgi:hypothetical protein